MNVYAIISLIQVFIAFLTGNVVLFKDRRAALNRTFFLLAFLVALLSLAEFGLRSGAPGDDAFHWEEITALWPLTNVILFHFVLLFARWKTSRGYRPVLIAVYLAAMILVICHAFPGVAWSLPTHEYWGWSWREAVSPTFRVVDGAYSAVIGILTLATCIIYAIKTADAIQKDQARQVGMGTLIMITGSLLTQVVFPRIGILIPETYNLLYVVLFCFIAYATAKFEMFAVTPTAAIEGIISTMTEAFFLTDTRGTILATNPAAISLLGVAREDLVGLPVTSVMGNVRFEIPEIGGGDPSLLFRAGVIQNLEGQVTSKHGCPVPVLISKSPLRENRGRVQGYIWILTDMSALKRAEQGRLEERERVTQELIAKFSHELRNPLNVIIGFTSLLIDSQMGPVSPDQKGCLEDVHATGKYLLSLVDEILDMAKIEAGVVEFPRAWFKVEDILEEIAHPVQQANLKKQHAIEFDVQDRALSIYSSKLKLQQVLLNLLSNAIKYTPAGGRIALVIHPKNTSTVSFSVADNGVGIKDEDKPRIFHKFTRLDPTVEGTGLGLALSKQIVKQLGSDLQFVSTVGVGTTFFFDLHF